MVTDLSTQAPGRHAPIDAESLARAYDDHAASMFRVLRRLGVSEVSVEDALQDVFLVAWRRREDFEGRAAHRTWLYGIALRVARDYRRQQDREKREVAEVEVPHHGADPETHAAQAHALRQLDALLARVSDTLREVFVLMEVEQLRAKEVAELLEIPLNTVYSRQRRAREELMAATESGKP